MKEIIISVMRNLHILLLTFPIWSFILLGLITLLGHLFIFLLGCTIDYGGVANVSNCFGESLWENMINSGWGILVVIIYSPFVMLVGFLIWLYKVFIKKKSE
ncbi:MAG: hypothetical protein ACLFPL_04790 [Candidatus Nanoarchaeia archaeon]